MELDPRPRTRAHRRLGRRRVRGDRAAHRRRPDHRSRRLRRRHGTGAAGPVGVCRLLGAAARRAGTDRAAAAGRIRTGAAGRPRDGRPRAARIRRRRRAHHARARVGARTRGPLPGPGRPRHRPGAHRLAGAAVRAGHHRPRIRGCRRAVGPRRARRGGFGRRPVASTRRADRAGALGRHGGLARAVRRVARAARGAAPRPGRRRARRARGGAGAPPRAGARLPRRGRPRAPSAEPPSRAYRRRSSPSRRAWRSSRPSAPGSASRHSLPTRRSRRPCSRRLPCARSR